ncbi:MAG: glycosyltransferase family 4 protein [Ruminococcaceae bacterium]|nr:glycosyltransferase family 4 protein [Oscillospiraceae bacterium]
MENTKANTPAHTLIINYAGLQPGGVETYFSDLMKYSLDRGYRVVWITTPSCVQNAFYREIADDPRVEKLFAKMGRHWFRHEPLCFTPMENVTMLSCEPLHFMRAESLREKANVNSFHHFLVLPHYTGSAYYPERLFNWRFLKAFWYRYMKKLACKWVEADCIRAFSLKHLDAYEENYGVTIPDKTSKILGRIEQIAPIDKAALAERASQRNENFTIVTCARFDFPHKAYLLGLIDSYGALKPKYPQLKLVVVGYGKGEAALREKIAVLPEQMQRDIVLPGALSMEQLKKQFRQGHLNVGLAGAILDGAACALPSLLTRHYTDLCETYGFLSDISGNLLREDPGHDSLSYIERVLNMSDEDYILQCRRDYQAARSRRKSDPDYFFRQNNGVCGSVVNAMQTRLGKILNLCGYLKYRLWGAEGYNN